MAGTPPWKVYRKQSRKENTWDDSKKPFWGLTQQNIEFPEWHKGRRLDESKTKKAWIRFPKGGEGCLSVCLLDNSPFLCVCDTCCIHKWVPVKLWWLCECECFVTCHQQREVPLKTWPKPLSGNATRVKAVLLSCWRKKNEDLIWNFLNLIFFLVKTWCVFPYCNYWVVTVWKIYSFSFLWIYNCLYSLYVWFSLPSRSISCWPVLGRCLWCRCLLARGRSESPEECILCYKHPSPGIENKELIRYPWACISKITFQAQFQNNFLFWTLSICRLCLFMFQRTVARVVVELLSHWPRQSWATLKPTRWHTFVTNKLNE